jgi:hypothetical protein
MTSLTGLTVMIPDHGCSRTDAPSSCYFLLRAIPAYRRKSGESTVAHMRREPEMHCQRMKFDRSIESGPPKGEQWVFMTIWRI